MAGSTISGTITQTVVLGRNAAYHSPLTITDTGVIAPTIYGTDGVYVSAGVKQARIQNHGTITGASGGRTANDISGGVGVDFSVMGRLINSGSITGGIGGYGPNHIALPGGAGVILAAGGRVENTGSIAGGYNGGTGVALSVGGTIVNHGQIAGGNGAGTSGAEGGAGGIGIVLLAGGSVTHCLCRWPRRQPDLWRWPGIHGRAPVCPRAIARVRRSDAGPALAGFPASILNGPVGFGCRKSGGFRDETPRTRDRAGRGAWGRSAVRADFLRLIPSSRDAGHVARPGALPPCRRPLNRWRARRQAR
jgi:hypothetical protein